MYYDIKFVSSVTMEDLNLYNKIKGIEIFPTLSDFHVHMNILNGRLHEILCIPYEDLPLLINKYSNYEEEMNMLEWRLKIGK